MPRGDGTGPAGRGPMTGRAAGYCAGFNVPGYMNEVPGRGRGFGRGLGRGRGFGYGRGFGRGRGFYAQQPVNVQPVYQPNNPQQSNVDPDVARKQELEYLKNTEQAIKNELNAVKERIDELENKSE
ncbi:MAG: DUF5320 domain-containing protein [Halanaerobiaceae bacterium]